MDPESELAGFVAKFAPDLQEQIWGCRAALRRRFPRALELVYDNYNFFVIGYGPTARTSEAVFSLAAYAKGVNLCFLQHGPELPDPTGILRGGGKVVRTVRLASPADLERADVVALMDAEVALASIPMSTAVGPELIIKSVSAKQRPRH